MFYRQSRDVNRFLQSNGSVSRTNYMRILALASIDIILMLPTGVVSIALTAAQALSFGPPRFYFGWTYEHTGWEPMGAPYAPLVASGSSTVAQLYFSQWTSPVLAFAIFGLFGVTSEARASYWHIICALGGWFGWRPTPRVSQGRSSLGDIEFCERTRQGSGFNVE